MRQQLQYLIRQWRDFAELLAFAPGVAKVFADCADQLEELLRAPTQEGK